jgi:hypothetical protein
LHDTAIEEEELQQILQRIVDKIPDISLIVAAPFDLNIRCKVLPL